jgi:zinc protease
MKLTLLPILLCLAVPAAGADFRMPEPQQISLDNGLTVLFREDHRLPVVSFTCLVGGAGTAGEPAGQAGVADLTSQLLLRGTVRRNAEAVADELDFLGADLSADVREEFAAIRGQCQAEYFEKILGIAGECLTGPAFAPAEFRQERDRQRERILAIKDDPAAVIEIYFRQVYFGTHPLGRPSLGTTAGLGRLKPEDVRTFYAGRYRPDRVVLAVVGDLSRERLMEALKEHFARWSRPATPAPALDLPAPPAPKGKTVVIVDQPGATQAYFMLGGPGFAMGDPVAPTAEVLNTLFGGRFTSWLNNELRIQRGLTYGAASRFDCWRQGGLFVISSYTQTEKIGEMTDLTLSLLQKARQDDYSEAAVTSARNYILGQFPLTLESAASLARAYAELWFFGLGFDYYTRLLQQVRTVTPEAGRKAALRLLPQDDFVLVVVGRAAAVRPQLERIGPVKVLKQSETGF